MTRSVPRAWRSGALAVGLALLAVLGVVAWFQPLGALQAWYGATVFWTDLSLGALATLMMHHLTGGEWGWFLRPLLLPAIAALPLVLLAYLPLLSGLELLFPWADSSAALPAVVQRKLAYLNESFFIVRALVYAGVWLGLAMLVGRRRFDRDESNQGLAAVGLILYALTITFYGIDWVHSLAPTFYSSTIGYLLATGQLVVVLAFAILVAARLQHGAPDRARTAFHDLGNLLLAAVMLWAYIAFTEYLIIWIADLPNEIEWYRQRQQGGWYPLTLWIAALHFAVPFVLLLFRRVKQSPALLGGLAGVLVAAHVLLVLWLVEPSFASRPPHAWLIDVLAVLALGAWWAVVYLSRLGQPFAGEAVTADG